MLVLTRRHSESLIIGRNIKVTILGRKGNGVRIGVDAPMDVPVHREEVYKSDQGDHRDPPKSMDRDR